MPSTLQLIKSDLKRKQEIFHQDGAEISLLRTCLTDGTSANILFRLAARCAKTKVLAPIALIIQHVNRVYNGCVIGVNADFGEGFVIMHPIGVVINSKVKGGINITLESGVVMGDEKGKSPTLGSHIFIGAGAKVFGPITVGNNVKVGANAVVVKDVESNKTALGIPAKSK
ncbi:serine O-acetyltransferase [Alteromonas sp. 76-1]|jgi:serine O-acetyltransferase|uniref:serine O-acetyltransferase n=1 Tax=Alteromonas sp. 76-1 TaxID=2358187 RepID=UPI000FD15E30|nr:serine acetyltransferase [Alteromonas sp. 76-1]VEL97876.1 serine O-acetyltransferase [Alteromonas sp. 76-1]